MAQSDQCPSCALYRGLGECAAFPDGIPQEIMAGEFDHTQPHEGDNGKRFVRATESNLGLAFQE